MSHDLLPPIISPEQCRAARAVLKMTVTDACEAAGVSRVTLVKFEAGGEVRPYLGDRLRTAFEQRGITFAEDGQGIRWSDGQP